MNGIFKDFLGLCAKFFTDKVKISLSLLVILGIIVFFEYYTAGLARRTYVFYTVDGRALAVEDRNLKRANSPEQDIKRYLDDALLGPVSPGLLPLFSGIPRLESLIYQDGVVFADFSRDSTLPPEGGWLDRSFYTLYSGVRRNFPYVKDVRFFIEGRAAYPGEFEKFMPKKIKN